MPSPLTHAIVGAATARTLPDTLPRWRLALFLAVVAVLPDLDLAAFFLGFPSDHLLAHRGLTHALPVAVLAGLLTVPAARAVLKTDTGKARRIGLAVALALASHGILDTATNGGAGVGLLMPLSDARMAAPYRPVTVSPLRLDHFLSSALRVFASEALWIWIPTAFATLLPTRRRGQNRFPNSSRPARCPSSIKSS